MKGSSFPCTLILVLLTIHLEAQVNRESTLFKALKSADSLLFEEGFNKCDLAALNTVLHEDLEFFHDQNGTQNLDGFHRTFSQSICSSPKGKPIRKLVDETLKVFPLKNEGKIYGAIQTGAHVFYMKEPDKAAYATQQAKFNHLWVLEKGQWQLKRSLSYDHRPPEKDYGPRFQADYAYELFNNDREIEQLLQKHKIPSIGIGYIQEGKLQQLRTFGEQSAGNPISINSIYKVASLTKPITALVVLKLIDEGSWSLDEPVSDYYVDDDIAGSPDLDKLSTRHILSHQTGLPNWRYLTEDNKLSFEFEPGTKWQYSGEGYEYLRKAIENKFGRPFEEIAQEKLFQPLGMKDTHFYWTPKIDKNLYAIEHDADGEPIEYTEYTTTNASANLMTTVGDYSRFLVHVLNGASLSEELYSEFLTPQSHQKEGITWGLGMQILPDLPNKDLALMHTGGDHGTKAIAMLLKNSGQGLVLFSNSEKGMLLWQKVLTEYFGEVGEEIVRRNLE